MGTVTINVPQPQRRTLVNSSSRDELIIGHLSLVRSVAASVANSVPAHLDHGHSGIKGLIAAATRYQTDRDTNFASYAKHSHSRCYPLNSLRQADAASGKLRASYKKAQLTRDRLRFQLDREPTDLDGQCDESRSPTLEIPDEVGTPARDQRKSHFPDSQVRSRPHARHSFDGWDCVRKRVSSLVWVRLSFPNAMTLIRLSGPPEQIPGL